MDPAGNTILITGGHPASATPLAEQFHQPGR
jgi:hypothetical protein